MKMHCAVVLEVLRALTANETVLYWLEVAFLLTTRHPDGDVVRLAASTVAAIENKDIIERMMEMLELRTEDELK
jgi:hypothetical protein